jgi:hypothetical protein
MLLKVLEDILNSVLSTTSGTCLANAQRELP